MCGRVQRPTQLRVRLLQVADGPNAEVAAFRLRLALDATWLDGTPIEVRPGPHRRAGSRARLPPITDRAHQRPWPRRPPDGPQDLPAACTTCPEGVRERRRWSSWSTRCRRLLVA